MDSYSLEVELLMVDMYENRMYIDLLIVLVVLVGTSKFSRIYNLSRIHALDPL